ncbi:hypothetical protein K504DRAFT_459420 [Pleomassaria siparia CBS 279.74]|uniref:Extracellular membrane protein CFEM domain-containing protein n=1 Tax=Pleomassaria siparia CBS 279.74 TaxID=1314801 RepID=A0A6G1K2E9_9PLEO|nr:hypothetical protein K504DRAFT_459420 [Pleomassaria siparia CBS 279.74]
MSFSTFHSASWHLFVFTLVCVLQITNAQIGTMTQDLTTLAAFPLQKACAQSCFVTTGFCPEDILGSKIGCAVHTDCFDSGWQAKNDCYCRQDLQNDALGFLSSCVSKGCRQGDVAIDASTAGSLYVQYCRHKGYPAPTEPATIAAQTTGPPGGATKTTGGISSGPTDSTTQTSSSKPSALSMQAIIGIAVGGLVGLTLLASGLNRLRKRSHRSHMQHPQQPQVSQQPAMYPPNYYHEPYYPQPSAASEVGPDDSVSMVGGPARPAPTLVSHAPMNRPGW